MPPVSAMLKAPSDVHNVLTLMTNVEPAGELIVIRLPPPVSRVGMFRTFCPGRPFKVVEPRMLRPQLAPSVQPSFAVAADTLRAFAAAAFTVAASAVTPDTTVPPPRNEPLRTTR